MFGIRSKGAKMICNGRFLEVTSNLCATLRYSRARLSVSKLEQFTERLGLSTRENGRRIWINALCINRADNLIY